MYETQCGERASLDEEWKVSGSAPDERICVYAAACVEKPTQSG